ncbi:hypothetical protein AKJ45_01620 [candidate division MSBL1 archaeon SCGC-AAA261F19]|uniref:GINS subunit domain-containing protein n=2 Tax=candidate division MSBL1 TaxID=215777 RepID=A0A133VAH5_9EURY|nr:hypothetical protein AKJ43_01150 [candidate division MSBL1 archaeon SCGC-AAA261D19]KXB03436.1 hypothetical protein AKJ45_01620 [candidate division MSBL1 archaeon SCGC-AAA261F19]
MVSTKQLVRVLEDLSELELVGRSLGPLESGEEVYMRPWEASVLERRGIVEPTENFTLVGLRKRILAEEKSSKLEDLPESFYQVVFHRIENLRLEDRHDRAKEIDEALSALLDLRVQKLARLSISSTDIEGLPFEEKFLVNRLSDVISEWRRRLNSFFERPVKEGVDVRG